jgi:hypothetical protein
MFALAAFVLGFAVCFVPYNVHAARVTARDGTLIRKPIYGFYISQGWVDPRPNAYPDTEADGYLYAISLYGSPESNHESLIEAIGRHPGTAWRRVRLNFSAFYARFLSGEFFPAIWTLFAALGVIFAWARGTRTERRVAPFLLGCFGCTHFILIFHIDPRYLTIGVPPLLLLAAFGADRVVTLSGKPWRSRIVATAVIAVLAWAAHGQIERWRNCNPTDLRGVVAMRSLGEHFRHVVPRPTLAVNREPHIEFVSSANVPLPGEDAFLLAYFSHTAWVGLGADGPFPRGKFYAYRASPADYRYVPADELKQHPVSEGTVIDEYENPVLGRYALVKLSGRK